MEKIFVLVVGLIIFSVTNFASAAHYWVTSGGGEFLSDDIHYYIDTDELGIVYNDSEYETYYNDLASNYANDNPLKFSKDKNKISSKAVLFKVRIISVNKGNSNLKPRIEDCYFYRQMGEIQYSVFNDFEVNYLIYSFTRKKERRSEFEGSGIRCISFYSNSNDYFDDLAIPYLSSAPREVMMPLDKIYNKARELFGVKNNYRNYDEFTKNYFENKDIGLLQFNNYVKRYSDSTFPTVYCGINYITGYGQSTPFQDVFLITNSPIGTKDNLFCVTKMKYHNSNSNDYKFFGFHFWKFIQGVDVIVCENALGEFLGTVSRDENELLYNIYVESAKRL